MTSSSAIRSSWSRWARTSSPASSSRTRRYDGEPPEGLSVANMRVDFMVDGPELEVDAVLPDGTAMPLVRNEDWQRT